MSSFYFLSLTHIFFHKVLYIYYENILRGGLMNNKIYNTKEVIADRLDLPRDILLDIPKIVITGNNEINIENHKGIILFEDNLVKINSKIGSISILGKGFEILFIGGSTLTISGVFKSVIYEGNE